MKLVLIIIMGVFLSFNTNSFAGCRISLTVKNVGNSVVSVMTSGRSTAVKSRGGSWARLKNGFWMTTQQPAFDLNIGERLGDTYRAKFGCRAKRRYRINYYCPNNSNYVSYYPSATGWTKRTNITVNVGSHCN